MRETAFEWARLLVVGLLLGLALSCSAAPVVATVAVQEELSVDDRRRILARHVVDLCTSLPTTEERIMVVDWMLRNCRESAVYCLRLACAEMEGEGCKKPSREIRWQQ